MVYRYRTIERYFSKVVKLDYRLHQIHINLARLSNEQEIRNMTDCVVAITVINKQSIYMYYYYTYQVRIAEEKSALDQFEYLDFKQTKEGSSVAAFRYILKLTKLSVNICQIKSVSISSVYITK